MAGLLHRDDLDLVRNLLQKKNDDAKIQSPQEFQTLTKDGETVWLEVNTRIMKENGRSSLPEAEGKEVAKKSVEQLYDKPEFYRLMKLPAASGGEFTLRD